MDHLESLTRYFGSENIAKDAVAAAERLLDAVSDALGEDPLDRTFEEMSDADILLYRTRLATEGMELTPDELRAVVQVICLAHKTVRGEL